METKEPIRLNLGSGPNHMPGYVNLDIKDGHRIDAIDVENGTADEIRASHVLEHESHNRSLDILRHWFDKLRPGGIVKIAVPNLEYIIAQMSKDTGEPLEGFLMGGQTDADDYHKSVWTYNKLDHALRAAGFICVRPWESDFSDCSALPVSLNLMGMKPDGPATLENVCVLMSVPRLMFTDNVIPMMGTLTQLRMPILANTGAFWGQCLERIMEDVIHKMPHITHVMTCDYDSIFSVDQVLQLYRTAISVNADAIFPVQVKRQAAHAMLSIREADGTMRTSLRPEDVKAEALRVCTGHFGMTMLRTDRIRTLAKPWFKEVPDANGGWGDGHIDPDIWFWNNWEKAGFSLYQANHVRIGHAQLMSTFPDRSWQPRHVHMSEVQESGIPLFAR